MPPIQWGGKTPPLQKDLLGSFWFNNAKNGASGTCSFKPLALEVGDPAKEKVLESIWLAFSKVVWIKAVGVTTGNAASRQGSAHPWGGQERSPLVCSNHPSHMFHWDGFSIPVAAGMWIGPLAGNGCKPGCSRTYQAHGHGTISRIFWWSSISFPFTHFISIQPWGGRHPSCPGLSPRDGSFT